MFSPKFLITAFLFSSLFLVGCSPKVDCSSRERYLVTLNEVMDDLAKTSPKDADFVKSFMEQSSFYNGGMDKATCNMNSDELRYYVRSSGKHKYDPFRKDFETKEMDHLDTVQQSIDEAFGKKKK